MIPDAKKSYMLTFNGIASDMFSEWIEVIDNGSRLWPVLKIEWINHNGFSFWLYIYKADMDRHVLHDHCISDISGWQLDVITINIILYLYIIWLIF